MYGWTDCSNAYGLTSKNNSPRFYCMCYFAGPDWTTERTSEEVLHARKCGVSGILFMKGNVVVIKGDRSTGQKKTQP